MFIKLTGMSALYPKHEGRIVQVSKDSIEYYQQISSKGWLTFKRTDKELFILGYRVIEFELIQTAALSKSTLQD
jgi:hypothetical protein